jgi:murein DD-endopeptidase MepM/ murein hydrolase activator NlpD
VRTRHIEVRGAAIRMYCSEACRRRDGEPAPVEPPRSHRPGRLGRAIVLASVATGGLAALALWTLGGNAEREAGDGALPFGSEAFGPPRPAADEAFVEHGPAWPPTEQERIRMLADDAWIHPLQGPTRRMPIRASRVFGASRPGSRPSECRAGHCGVDLGGERWGEPILAVQDGVVERVVRDENANGGRYVWLAHRDGTVYTHYFHLAAIPPDLREGQRVSRGQTIGLLGATGVSHSGPHLHFTVAVQLPGDASRQYIDPEPLIALWPMETPVSCDTSTMLSTSTVPGRVIGAHGGASRARAPAPRIASRDGAPAQSAEVASAADAGDDDGEARKTLRPISRIPSLSGEQDSDRVSGDGAEIGTLPGFAAP